MIPYSTLKRSDLYILREKNNIIAASTKICIIKYTPKGLEGSDASNTVDRVAVQFVKFAKDLGPTCKN